MQLNFFNSNMVTLPPEYTATKYFGYFWNTREQQLYSIKMAGVLRPLKSVKPNKWNELPGPAYRVSDKGRDRYLLISDLKKLTVQDSVIPVEIRING